MPQLDAYTPAVVGAYGYNPSRDEIERIQAFLSTYDTPTKLNSIVIVPDARFAQAQREFSAPLRRRKVAFTLPSAQRTYINANLLKTADPYSGFEWALAHELQHLNDSRTPQEQEQMDEQIDQAARSALISWRHSQAKSSALRKLRTNQAGFIGQMPTYEGGFGSLTEP